MKVYIASDHAGLETKNRLADSLSADFDVEDLGPNKLNPDDDYPVFAEKVARAVIGNAGSMGILVCKSGQGMAIAANKVDGVRAALVWNERLARETRTDNDSNVLSLPAGEIEADEMIQIARTWLNTPFSNETRHQRRIDQISQMEHGSE